MQWTRVGIHEILICMAEDNHAPAVTIDTLPDNIFREIFREVVTFKFYISEPCPYWLSRYPEAHATAWQRLVQVCQRWRNIIFGSPRYLDLHLHCSEETPFWENSSCWPEFPLTLKYTISPDEDDDDVIFALKHPDRVRRVDLSIRHSDSIVHEVLEVMEVPFPALTHLDLAGPDSEDDPEIFDLSGRFLGQSAPCLEHIHLDAISFPALPKLLSSARGLVCLELRNIHATCYKHLSSKAMVGGLAGLTKLINLSINFTYTDEDPSYYELPQKRSRPMRATLPALTQFKFTGECDYLEALIAQIDTPQVEVFKVAYPTPEVQTSQLSQYFDRTERLESARFRRAQVSFDRGKAQIELDRSQGECDQVCLSLSVAIEDDYYNVPCLLDQLDDILSDVDHLSVEMGRYWTNRGDRSETSKWLAFLRIFPAVEVLCVSGGIAVNIASTLENIPGESVTEVLPALRLLHLRNGDEPVGSIERFVSLRGLSDCPVTVVDTQDGINE